MGGKKRKIPIELIQDKKVRSVAFSKRRYGLGRKSSELCIRSPETKIAVIMGPPSTNSYTPYYTLGHPSVDGVVSIFLRGQSPTTNQQENKSGGLEFWWEFFDSFDLDELEAAIKEITSTKNKARLLLDSRKSNQIDLGSHRKEEILQLSNNISDESKDQIPKIDEGSTSGGSGSLVEIQEEYEQLPIDDFFTDVQIYPF